MFWKLPASGTGRESDFHLAMDDHSRGVSVLETERFNDMLLQGAATLASGAFLKLRTPSFGMFRIPTMIDDACDRNTAMSCCSCDAVEIGGSDTHIHATYRSRPKPIAKKAGIRVENKFVESIFGVFMMPRCVVSRLPRLILTTGRSMPSWDLIIGTEEHRDKTATLCLRNTNPHKMLRRLQEDNSRVLPSWEEAYRNSTRALTRLDG